MADEGMAEEPTPGDGARVRLAAELRRMVHLVVGRELSVADLDEMTAALAPLAAWIEDRPPRVRDSRTWVAGAVIEAPGDGEAFADSLMRPVSGTGNPFSIPMTMYRDGEAVTSTVTLDAAFEGAPGRSHGGFVSAVFDDLFGSLPMLQGKIAFTGSLTINYVAPSPVYEPVTYRGWVERVEGKKLFVAGEAHHGELLVTTASAVFIDATEALARLYGA